MAKPMLETSPSPAERDLPYIYNILIAKTEDDVLIVGDVWIVTAVELESGTGGHQDLEVKTESHMRTIKLGSWGASIGICTLQRAFNRSLLDV